jgi:hypothetical protein
MRKSFSVGQKGICKMEVDKHVLFLVPLLCLVVWVGCSKEVPISKDKQDSKNERVPSKLEAVQVELTNLANRVHVGNVPSYDYVTSLREKLSEMSYSERETALTCVEDVFSYPRLRQFPLSQRENSVLAYSSIVLKLTNLFAEELEKPEKAWTFLLRTILVFDTERDIVSAPIFDPHTPPMGLHITKGMYVDAMEREKFNAVRRGFEESRYFMRYFYRLPVEQQKEWIDRLQKVAGRKVVIYNPDDPASEPLKRRIVIPSHLPPQIQEKMRAIRREALIKAGIDPATEGL